MQKNFYIIFLFLICGIFCGCAISARQYKNIPLQNALLPSEVKIDSVPALVQEDYQCGPAALAMVLNWCGEVEATPEKLSSTLFTPSKSGSFQSDLVAAARRQGKIAYVIPPNPEALFHELAVGHPVIILQNLGLSWWPRWHYSVVVGYDVNKEHFLVHSGRETEQIISFTPFDNTWQRSGYWALVVLPPDQLPATAEQTQFLESIISLEQTGNHEAAIKAYQAAQIRWPDAENFLIGEATSYYKNGKLLKSEQILKEGSKNFPNSQPILNNYAEVLAALGKYEEALKMAEKAVSIPGPFKEIAQRTMLSIKNRSDK